MPSVTLALKDLRLLLRDSRSAVILLLMPVALILVLGLSLGEAFGRKADNSLRISVVVEDEGLRRLGELAALVRKVDARGVEQLSDLSPFHPGHGYESAPSNTARPKPYLPT